MDLKEKVKKLPACPGVYLMKDSQDSIIYVGKSKNLKSRVGSYFLNSKSHPPKVVKLVNNLKDFDIIVTDTEFEAFMLECKLIQEIRPFYNRQMKSPESYSYIRIKTDEAYPPIEIASNIEQKKGYLYFGPYVKKSTLERGLQGIKECCRILCTASFRKPSPCLNHSLGTCIGVCLESTPREQYLTFVEKVIALLKGTDKSIIELIEQKMQKASERFDFENAAKYRDYLKAVGSLAGRIKVIEYTKENKNIAVLEYINEDEFKFFLIKGGKVLFSEKYALAEASSEELKRLLKLRVLSCFTGSMLNADVIIGRDEIDEARIIYTYLKSKSQSRKHIVIARKWLDSSNDSKLDKALDKLLAL